MPPQTLITTRAAGRLASVLFLGSGLLSLVTLPLPAAPDLNRAATFVVSLCAVAAGVVTWQLPWERWPRNATLAVIPVAFVLIAAGNAFGGSNFLTYSIFFVVAFVWIGISQPQRTSLFVSPLALAAYIVPLFPLNVDLGQGIASAALTVPVCVLVGESLSWSALRVVRTNEELQKEREIAGRLHELQQMEETWITAVAHELRTPITICRGHLEVLGPDADREEMRRAIGVVRDELERMGRLAEDVTTLAGLKGRSFIHRRRIHLIDFVADVAAKAEPLLDGRLRIEPVPEHVWLRADPDRLTQALLNLLNNVAVHTPDGTPVDLRVVRDRRAWRFEVSDHGPGLPSGMERSAFRLFRSRRETRKEFGLGLAIVKGIARAHHGSVGVRNRPGKGVTFWMRIPA